MAADWLLFWVFAPISVGSAALMLFQRNAVHAALLLIVNFFTVAVFFLLLGSEFLFVVQIIVYAGAIMVLFLFVIMLLGVDRDESLIERIKGQRTIAVLLGLGIAAEVFFAVRAGMGFAARAPEGFDQLNEGGNAQALGRILFRDYFLPFEVTSILLIVAAIAVVVLARRRDVPPPEALEGPGGADRITSPGEPRGEREPVA